MGCGASTESFDPSKETIQQFQARQQWNRFVKMNDYEKRILLLHSNMGISHRRS